MSSVSVVYNQMSETVLIASTFY